MDIVHALEQTFAGWYKNVPHLPRQATEWIAKNSWWLVVIGIIIGIFITLQVFLLSGILLLLMAGGKGATIIGGAPFLVQIMAFVLVVISLGIACMAVQPLHNLHKKGWTLLFILVLIELASIVVVLISTFDIFRTIQSLLVMAIAGYFLFEIRGHFSHAEQIKPNKTVRLP